MFVFSQMPALAGFLLGVLGLYWNLPQGEGWVVSQPNTTASPEIPFSTGLVETPVDTWLNPLQFWLSKQTNATSLALSGLLTDVDSVRHATLQNRAAIDFLLLAQGHGCEDFEGMCCMNLSDHSESIFKSIQQLKDGVKRLTEEAGLDWLTRMFKGWGLSGWLISLVKTVGVVILIIVTVLLMLPCLVSLLQRALQKTVQAIFLAQIQKGGIVGGGSGSASSLTEEEFNLDEIPVYP